MRDWAEKWTISTAVPLVLVAVVSIMMFSWIMEVRDTCQNPGNIAVDLQEILTKMEVLQETVGKKDSSGVGKEKEYAMQLIDKQLQLKRVAHETQLKAARRYREACISMKDPKMNRANAWVIQAYVMFWMYENTYQCSVDQRFGRNGDGGKFLCNPDVVASNPCVLYSFGVKDDYSFELEVNTRVGCKAWLYDPTIDVGPVKKEFNEYHKDMQIAKIGIENTDAKSSYKRLSTLMKENGHDYIDVLKIDIEGAEKRVFKELFQTHNEAVQIKHPQSNPADFPIATVILAELHYDNADMWPPEASNANFTVLNTWVEFFQLLEDQGYAIYHQEMNLYAYQCAEYAWVHVATMEKLERNYMVSLLNK